MIRLELPYDVQLIPGTAYWLSDIARRYGVSEKLASSLCFVIEATLEQRVTQPCDGPAVFLITLDDLTGTVSVSITDKGMPYILTEKYREMLQAGLVSSFSFDQLAIDGQRLTLNVKKENETRQNSPAVETEVEKLLDQEISCRLTKANDEDILEAIRVMYSTYGFRYIHQDIYHHDHFRAALQSGKYVSILAENAHAQTVGHAAMEEHDWFPGIPEVCNLVVKDFARGLKVSGLLVDAALEAGTSKGFEGLYGLPVVHHPISQKLFNRHEFTACGFYFHLAPANLLDPENKDGNRVDAALCVKILNKDKVHPLCLPAECEEFVRKVFESEGAAYELLPEGESPSPKLKLSYKIDAVTRLLEIQVDNVGRNFDESIRALKVPEGLEMSEVVMLYLNMNDPGCLTAYRFLREHGFIFTGCLPGSTAGDYLLLQNLKGAPVVQEKMVLEPNYREMLDRLQM